MKTMKFLESYKIFKGLTYYFGYISGDFHYLLIASSRQHKRTSMGAEWKGFINTVKKDGNQNKNEVV